jgi:hypothetical protein
MSVVNDLIEEIRGSGGGGSAEFEHHVCSSGGGGDQPSYPAFTTAAQTTKSKAQALRAYPQYGTINTTNSGGDKTGRSMYHAGVVKVTQRLSDGFLFQSSYTYSKLMTDADSFNGSTGSMDTAQPELEWSVGRLDQTHSIKLSTLYELPFGEGKPRLRGASSKIVGGWRIGGQN